MGVFCFGGVVLSEDFVKMNVQDLHYWEIFVKINAGSASEEEITELDKWIKKSEENWQTHTFFDELWARSDFYDPSITFDAKADWTNILDGMERDERRKTLHLQSGKMPSRSLIRIAAAIALIITFIFAYQYLITSGPDTNVDLLKAETTSTQRTDLLLDDGTRIWLNNNSSLRYPQFFTQTKREVYLAGEGYFEIKEDAERPFIVHAGTASIRVLGTSFNLRAYQDENKIILWVVDGSVAFSNDHGSSRKQVNVIGTEMAELNTDSGEIRKSALSNPNYFAWKTGQLFFENTLLLEVIPAIETTYNVQCVIGDPDIALEKFTGAFDEETIEQVLQVITSSIGCQFTYKDGIYIITKKPGNTGGS